MIKKKVLEEVHGEQEALVEAYIEQETLKRFEIKIKKKAPKGAQVPKFY